MKSKSVATAMFIFLFAQSCDDTNKSSEKRQKADVATTAEVPPSADATPGLDASSFEPISENDFDQGKTSGKTDEYCEKTRKSIDKLNESLKLKILVFPGPSGTGEEQKVDSELEDNIRRWILGHESNLLKYCADATAVVIDSLPLGFQVAEQNFNLQLSAANISVARGLAVTKIEGGVAPIGSDFTVGSILHSISFSAGSLGPTPIGSVTSAIKEIELLSKLIKGTPGNITLTLHHYEKSGANFIFRLKEHKIELKNTLVGPGRGRCLVLSEPALIPMTTEIKSKLEQCQPASDRDDCTAKKPANSTSVSYRTIYQPNAACGD